MLDSPLPTGGIGRAALAVEHPAGNWLIDFCKVLSRGRGAGLPKDGEMLLPNFRFGVWQTSLLYRPCLSTDEVEDS